MTISIQTGKEREDALRSISPTTAKNFHSLLKEIFEKEIAYRKSGADAEYFENIYWCAFLLFNVGDILDVEMMWNAKQMDMDIGAGFDVHYMVGAGVERTIDYCEKQNLKSISKYIMKCKEFGDFEEINEWKK